MKITPRNSQKTTKKFQMGGEMAPEDPAMAQDVAAADQADAQATGQDPIMMLAEMAMQALQAQDCQMALQVCDGFVQLIQQAQGGAGAPAEGGEPVYRKGGKLAYRIKK